MNERNCTSLSLDSRIRSELTGYKGFMSLYADDFCGNIISISPDEIYETASTIKTYILACLFDEVENRRRSLEETITYEPGHWVDGSGVLSAIEPGLKLRVKDAATWMIIVSDNIATNMIIDFLGIDTINQFMKRLGFQQTQLYNTIHFDRYRRLGATTPREYASLFIRMRQGALISPESDRKMLEILKKQHYNTMITRRFPTALMEDGVIHVASKSGSMNPCRNDGGLVYTPYGSYAIVMMHKDFDNIMEYNDHPAMIFGSRISRLILDQYLALEGRFLP